MRGKNNEIRRYCSNRGLALLVSVRAIVFEMYLIYARLRLPFSRKRPVMRAKVALDTI